jgi:hypothetical protein
VAEDLCQEDVVGHVLGFKLVAADSTVGAAEVAWFPGLVQRAEGVGNVLSPKISQAKALARFSRYGAAQEAARGRKRV